MTTKQGRIPETDTTRGEADDESTRRPGEPSAAVWSAPESGTVRGPTSGNNPAKGGDSVSPKESMTEKRERDDNPAARPGEPSDAVWSAPESGTVRE
jgi:hypothetical protein